MQRAHGGAAVRMAVAAAVTLCAGLALTGCGTAPNVAAYVDSQQFTEKQVDVIVDQATSAAATLAERGTHAPSRSDVVTTLVLTSVCRGAQAKQGFKDGQYTAEQVKQSEQVPASSQYASERAAMYACLTGLPIGAVSAPSEADLKAVYDLAKAHDLVKDPFEQIKDQLAADGRVKGALAVNRVLTELLKDGHLTVNPRYRPMTLPIFVIPDPAPGAPPGSVVALVALTIGEPASDAVVTASPTPSSSES